MKIRGSTERNRSKICNNRSNQGSMCKNQIYTFKQ